jgi:hypothetical protein
MNLPDYVSASFDLLDDNEIVLMAALFLMCAVFSVAGAVVELWNWLKKVGILG